MFRAEFSVKLFLFLLALALIASTRACAQESHSLQAWQRLQQENFNGHHQKTFTSVFNLEMGLAGLSLAADGFTTENNKAPHWNGEMNPILRKLPSTQGNALYFSAMFSGLVYSNHLLRNHPRLRHGLNLSVITLESFWSVYNATHRVRS